MNTSAERPNDAYMIVRYGRYAGVRNFGFIVVPAQARARTEVYENPQPSVSNYCKDLE